MDGVLLTGPQYLFLVKGVTAESGPDASAACGPMSTQSQEGYRALLAALLLGGKAIVTAPQYVTDSVDAGRLVSEGLVEFQTIDCSTPLRSSMASAYRAAFNNFRQLEQHPRYSRFVSWERELGTKLRAEDAIELAGLEGDTEYQLKRFTTTYETMVAFMGSIFGNLLVDNVDLYETVLSGFLSDRIGVSSEISRSRQLEKLMATGRPLFSILGLEIRPAEHYDDEMSLFSYFPSDLEDFKSLDQRMFQGLDTGGFMEHIQVSIDLRMRLSQVEFIHTHTLYKTIFELVDLMTFSSSQRCPIYAPGTLETRGVMAPMQRAPELTDQTALYKLFVAERGYVPNLNRLEDLLRLRDDRRLLPLRETLRTWEYEIRSHDVSAIQVVRRDVEKAQKELKSFGNLAKVGQYISYATIPIGVAEMLFMQTPCSLVAGAIGSATDFLARSGMKSMSWFNFGT